MRQKLYPVLMLFCSMVLFACVQRPTPAPTVKIYGPDPCNLEPGKTVPFSFTGENIPQNPRIVWQASPGSVDSPNKRVVQYTAPTEENTVVAISVSVSTNDVPVTDMMKCVVQKKTGETLPPTPTFTFTPGSQVKVSSDPPTPIDTPSGERTVAITEIMGNPCGETNEYANKYIELYNYGNQPVDVGGLFLTTTGQNGEPDEIVRWVDRAAAGNLGKDLITDSTILQPKQFGVVLSPHYVAGVSDSNMPYFFPKGIVILSIRNGDRIGNKLRGITTDASPYDAVLFYEGTTKQIKSVISTYGLYKDINFLNELTKKRIAGLPLMVENDGSSVERIVAENDDAVQNWRIILKGTPGSGPYH